MFGFVVVLIVFINVMRMDLYLGNRQKYSPRLLGQPSYLLEVGRLSERMLWKKKEGRNRSCACRKEVGCVRIEGNNVEREGKDEFWGSWKTEVRDGEDWRSYRLWKCVKEVRYFSARIMFTRLMIRRECWSACILFPCEE